jgi:hypothetical protein
MFHSRGEGETISIRDAILGFIFCSLEYQTVKDGQDIEI